MKQERPPCGQDCTSHSSANLIATRCMDGESKNAETYLPLPQPTRRRVCTGVCVIHFILCGLPELGRAILIIEQRLFALGAMRCRMRLVLYVVLTTFFRSSRTRSESKQSDRLWLLPWHVPPLPGVFQVRQPNGTNNGLQFGLQNMSLYTCNADT
jgi:hypothetical protein